MLFDKNENIVKAFYFIISCSSVIKIFLINKIRENHFPIARKLISMRKFKGIYNGDELIEELKFGFLFAFISLVQKISIKKNYLILFLRLFNLE